MSVKVGSPASFFPHPAHERVVANPEGAGDAPGTHPVLVGGEHLVLDLLAVARPRWLQDESAFTLQALGALRPVASMAVFADLLTAAARTNMDDGRRKHPDTSCLPTPLATTDETLPENAYQGMTNTNEIHQQNQFVHDDQLAEDVCNMLAYSTYDVALLAKLRSSARQELGYNLISGGFALDQFANEVNLENDILLQYEQSVEPQSVFTSLLADFRSEMDDVHALASRMKCEREPSKPIHLTAYKPQ